MISVLGAMHHHLFQHNLLIWDPIHNNHINLQNIIDTHINDPWQDTQDWSYITDCSVTNGYLSVFWEPPPTLLGLLGELIPQLPCNANTALGPFSACFVQFSVWHVCMLPSYYLFYLYEVLD